MSQEDRRWFRSAVVLRGTKLSDLWSKVASLLAPRRNPSHETLETMRNVRPLTPHLYGWHGSSLPREGANGRGGPMNNYMLWSRFAALNMAGMAGLALAYLNGWVEKVIAADTSHITLVIAALFAFGLIATGVRVHKVTRELDHICQGTGGRLGSYLKALRSGPGAHRALELRLFSRIAFVRHTANALVLLGLIGTVLGFIMALSDVSADAASDVSRVAPMIGTLISGMAVALYTTLVGAIFNLWLGANYQLLAVGTANLAVRLLEKGDAAGPAFPEGRNGYVHRSLGIGERERHRIS